MKASAPSGGGPPRPAPRDDARERPPAADGEEITYLIANHDRRAYIGECLASLRRQRDPRWRALIVDDASTDGSVEVIEARLGPRMRLLRNARNLGYTESLRRAIREATTDIVGILDPDDALCPDATGRVLRAYRQHPGAVLVHTRFEMLDEDLRSRLGEGGAPLPPGGTSLDRGHVGALRTFRRSAYRRTEGLDASLPYAEDRDLVYKLEEQGPTVFVDEVLYRYRRVPGSQSHDPVKREIGARNHLEAKRRALRRRGVRGLPKLLYGLRFRCEYVLYSERYPGLVKKPVDLLWRALLVLDLPRPMPFSLGRDRDRGGASPSHGGGVRPDRRRSAPPGPAGRTRR